MLARTLSPLEDDAAVAGRLAELRALRPPVRAFNIFVPEAVPLTGPAVDWDRVGIYVGRAIPRAASVGARVIVFGSAGARRVPDGFPYREAWEQLVRFLHLCADQASLYGITIAIEPVYSSNIITSYLEAADLAREVGREEVRVVADIIHFWKVETSLWRTSTKRRSMWRTCTCPTPSGGPPAPRNPMAPYVAFSRFCATSATRAWPRLKPTLAPTMRANPPRRSPICANWPGSTRHAMA